MIRRGMKRLADLRLSRTFSSHTPFILDGGMGHLLRRMGVEIKGEIGSVERFLGVALANLEQPEFVEAAHRAYLEAGASIITTNSYACVPGTIGNWPKTARCITAAGEIARAACEAHNKSLESKRGGGGGVAGPDAKVAGSIPPLHETYRPDKVGSDQELEEVYGQIVELVAPHCELLVCETMSSAKEARAAFKAASMSGLPVWVSWTLAETPDARLPSGEGLQTAIDALEATPEGYLVNCAQVEAVKAAIPILSRHVAATVGAENTAARPRVGAYANGFVTVKGAGDEQNPTGEYRQDLDPSAYAAHAKEWVGLGADTVGGCCGIFPEHIQALRAELM